MKRLSVSRSGCALLAAVLATTLFTGVAQAQRRDVRGPDHPPGWDHMDPRFGHNHYYPARGYYFHDLPPNRVFVNGPQGRYWVSGGVWYSYGPRGYVVVGAPVGMYVPVLPPYYTTVWVGGAPYYYANDTYYAWRESSQQYEVVDAPGDGAASTDAPPPPPSAKEDVFIYPKSGQSEEQQSQDKYECHKWAQNESGFDPTQPGGGVSPGDAGAKRAAYQRAISACLEGRGYSVK